MTASYKAWVDLLLAAILIIPFLAMIPEGVGQKRSRKRRS